MKLTHFGAFIATLVFSCNCFATWKLAPDSVTDGIRIAEDIYKFQVATFDCLVGKVETFEQYGKLLKRRKLECVISKGAEPITVSRTIVCGPSQPSIVSLTIQVGLKNYAPTLICED